MNISRLSDKNIEDTILKAHYHRKVIEHSELNESNLIKYTIKLDEEFRPDLVAYRALGSAELSWLVALICEVDDMSDSLPVGAELEFPQPSWIRASMREFIDEFGTV